MEVTNEAVVTEIDTEVDADDSVQPAELATTDVSEIDPLTGSGTSEPLVDNFDRNLTTENAASTSADTVKILEVTGKGIISVDTDIAQVQVGVEIEGDTAAEVQAEVAENLSAVVEQLDSLEVEDLQTVSVSLQPRLEFDNQGNSTVVGFTGRNILQFETTTEQAGETIDAAIAAGANTIQNINFVATDDVLKQARLDAIEIAAQDAQNQAVPLFETLELEPLEIVDIDIISLDNPSAESFSPQFDVAVFDASTPIIGGTQDVVAEVALDISYTEL